MGGWYARSHVSGDAKKQSSRGAAKQSTMRFALEPMVCDARSEMGFRPSNRLILPAKQDVPRGRRAAIAALALLGAMLAIAAAARTSGAATAAHKAVPNSRLRTVNL